MDLNPVDILHSSEDAGPTSLFKMLCEHHLGPAEKVHFKQPVVNRPRKLKKLQRSLYDTVFQYLKGPHRHRSKANQAKGNQLGEIETLFAFAFDLRLQRRFDDAARLEHLVAKFQKSEDATFSQKKAILKLLLCLQDSGEKEDGNVLGHGPVNLPVVFPDKSINIVLPDGPPQYGDTRTQKTSQWFMHYPKEVFEAPTQTLDSVPFKAHEFDLQLLNAPPGTGLHGRGFFDCGTVPPGSYLEKNRLTLCGALVDSRTSSLDTKLDMPEITGDGYGGVWEMRVPKAVEQSSTDEGFVDTSSVSSVSSHAAQRRPSSPDVWDLAWTEKPSRCRTWEGIGRYGQARERPYISEAGPEAFDHLYDLHLELLRLLDPAIVVPTRQTVSMSQLVSDAIYVLMGAPSESFSVDQTTGQFRLEDGIHVSGLSPETTAESCKPVIESGSIYRRLCHFARSQVIDSRYKSGLIFQAFTGAVRKYLEYYMACVLSVSKKKTLMQLTYEMNKVFIQMRRLAELCKCRDPRTDGEEMEHLPVGVQLLSYLYEETVDSAGSPHYPMMLSLLHTTCGPYIMFVQDWVFHGVCRDTYGEFMIQVNDEYLTFRDRQYWTQGYVRLTTEASKSVPLFLQDLAEDIFVCGKSINLLYLCDPQHFLFSVDQEVPRITITFSADDLKSINSHCMAYLSRMREIARQKNVSREELIARTEKAKHDLMVQARQRATRELDRLQAKIQEVKRLEDVRKRKLFSELKTQMEQDLRRRAGEKEEEKEKDRVRMEGATKHEILEAQVEEDIENRAREELIDYYSKLTEEAAFRELKALWKIRRYRLHGARLDFLDQDDAALAQELEENPLPAHGRSTWQVPATSPSLAPVAPPGEPEVATQQSSSLSPPPTTSSTSVDEPDVGLPKWAQSEAETTGGSEAPPSDGTLPRSGATLPHWAQEGLKKTGPMFGIDTTASDSLPGWAKQKEHSGALQKGEVELAVESQGETVTQGQKVAEGKATMADCMALPEAIDGTRVGLKQLLAVEVVADDPAAKGAKSHPSDSSVSSLMYPGKETSKGIDPEEQASSPAAEQPLLDDKDSKDALSSSPLTSKVETPERPAASKLTPPKVPTVGKSPKSAIKIVPGQHITMETEAETEAKASVKMQDGVSSTTESEERSEKPTIQIRDKMHATKESEAATEQKTGIKFVAGKNVMLESIEEQSDKPHIRTFEGKHSSVETTQDLAPKQSARTSRANLESIPELPKLPRRSLFGHISQLSREEINILAPKMKRRKEQYVSLESDWRAYQIKPHNKRIAGKSVDSQSVQERSVIPRLKTGLMFASKESEYVDYDELRLQKFRKQNVFGHASDSSVQKLLYYGKKQGGDEDASDGPLATDFQLFHDMHVEKLTDNFSLLNAAPELDLQASIGEDAFSGLADFSLRSTSGIDAHNYVALPTLLKRSVTALLQAQCSLVNQSIISYFMVDLAIEEHFKTLRSFLLMEDGEFGQSLSDQLFEKLATNPLPHELLNPVFLNATLSKALRSSLNGDKAHAPNLSFSVKYLPIALQPNAADALNCLELTYKVTWPVNIVISEAALNKYGRLFSFKLQLKRTVWVLKDVFHKLKRDVTVMANINAAQFRQLQLYRHEMQLFVKVIQGYTANQIIHVTWQEFQEDLSHHVNHLDDLYRRHTEYLNNSVCRCLLNKKAAPVMKIIQDIFGLILKFRTQLISDSWRRDEATGQLCHPSFEAMCKTYNSFSEYSRFLFRVVNKLAVRGYQAHLQELLLRLNFNNYYKADT